MAICQERNVMLQLTRAYAASAKRHVSAEVDGNAARTEHQCVSRWRKFRESSRIVLEPVEGRSVSIFLRSFRRMKVDWIYPRDETIRAERTPSAFVDRWIRSAWKSHSFPPEFHAAAESQRARVNDACSRFAFIKNARCGSSIVSPAESSFFLPTRAADGSS